MRRILPGSIVTYSQYGHLKLPKDLKSKCPKCGKISEFNLKFTYQEKRPGIISTGSCSLCNHTSHFVIMLNNATETNEEPSIYINEERNPFHQIEQNNIIPVDLLRAYRSAINVHNIKDTSATAVMTKRVLEGIIKSFLDEKVEGNSLSQQLALLSEHINFSKPLHQLSELVESQQKLYKTLELEIDPDEEMADLLIELLNSLIEYLFILPSKIDLIYERFSQKVD
ncbi:hypothetical protein [Bacillus sp. FJAT-45350]|uniref:hypothetical protein n=1 Tax=Bacillus sp. FJAT-45350 TaxID=2011014 RepID=UPI000BB77BE2|nr:hypothetical protein [Bacillus sp. FJAT-45350]